MKPQAQPADEASPWASEPIVLPIEPELDLHTFQPREVSALLEEYLTQCRQHGILTVRLIHGKGTGTLRDQVHRRLATLPDLVASHTWPAAANSGGWGATWVYLRGVSGGD